MYTDLIIFRNELKNKTIPKYKIVGIVSQLLLSRKIFPANIDIEKFLEDIFKLKFKTYLFKSRTLIIARMTREILSSENDNIYKNRLYQFVQEKIENLKAEIKNEKNEFDGWI